MASLDRSAGDLAERVASHFPKSRRSDLILLERCRFPPGVGLHPLRHVRAAVHRAPASGSMEVLKKMWPDAWGVRMEHILRNVLMALLEQPAATLARL